MSMGKDSGIAPELAGIALLGEEGSGQAWQMIIRHLYEANDPSVATPSWDMKREWWRGEWVIVPTLNWLNCDVLARRIANLIGVDITIDGAAASLLSGCEHEKRKSAFVWTPFLNTASVPLFQSLSASRFLQMFGPDIFLGPREWLLFCMTFALWKGIMPDVSSGPEGGILFPSANDGSQALVGYTKPTMGEIHLTTIGADTIVAHQPRLSRPAHS